MNSKKEKPSQWVMIVLISIIIISVALSILILCIWTNRDLKRAKNKQVFSTEINTSEAFTETVTEKITETFTETFANTATTDTGSHIRVLIKNDDSLYYENLYLSANKKWTIDDVTYQANEVVHIDSNFLAQSSKSKICCTCPDGFLFLCDKKGAHIRSGYKGDFYIVGTNSSNQLALINDIVIEDYIRFVLPSEMPTYFDLEALKAQAVCARTYAYSMLHNDTYASLGADVDDSTAFQVYNAIGSSAQTDKAVLETAGEILTYNNQPITCYYFSTCPGFTSLQSAWGDTNEYLPYIKNASTIPSQPKPYNLSTEKAFHIFINESPFSYDSQSPFYRWKATLDNTQVSSLGKLDHIAIQKRNESGYITLLQATFATSEGSCQQQYIGENEIRKFLGQFLCKLELNDQTIRTDFQMIPSACFEIKEDTADQTILYGGGFGHGVGLSQYAANALAAQGFHYQDILLYFFKDVSILNKE